MVVPFPGTTEDYSVEDFLHNVDEVASLGRWTEAQTLTITRLKLIGEAREFVKTDPDMIAAITWEPFKELLRERFRVKESPVHATQRFLDCFQRPAENVQNYATRLRAAGALTVRNTASIEENGVRQIVLQEQLLAQFLKGLRGNIRRFAMVSAPTTFKDAIIVTTREEANEALVSDKACAVAAVRDVVTNGPSFTPELSNAGPAPRPQNDPRPFHRPKCQLCLRIGHEARACSMYRMAASPAMPQSRVPTQSNAQRASARQTLCFRCNEPGHFARFCSNPPQPIQNTRSSPN